MKEYKKKEIKFYSRFTVKRFKKKKEKLERNPRGKENIFGEQKLEKVTTNIPKNCVSYSVSKRQ